MNRNAESHFAVAPATMDISRTMFDSSFGHTFTADFGQLVPFMCKEVLPGDTFNLTTSKVVRLQTLLKPTFGNMYLDTYYFFVPLRLVWSHFVNFMGESTDAWAPEVEYQIPQVIVPEGGFAFGSVADHLGVPPATGSGAQISALPFRCYSKIVNDWFRNQNLEDEVNVDTGDATVDINDVDRDSFLYGGNPYIVGKYHDMFTSALPGPLKLNSPVRVPVSSSIPAAPVVGFEDSWAYGNLSGENARGRYGFGALVATPYNLNTYERVLAGLPTRSTDEDANLISTDENSDFHGSVVFKNLGVNLDSFYAGISVADLRMSFQIQKFYESLARSGSRYTEILASLWKVHSPDSRLQRSEYLGGNRMPVSVSQVTNNAESSGAALGNVGAMSVTNDRSQDVMASFDEHGYLIGVCCLRYEHSYPQGLPKHFSRKDKFDFYWPVFANISEQPIYKKELYFTGTNTDDEVFGYQEPWCHYRYGFNTVSGEMRPDHPTSLASWNLADDYAEVPSLSHEWAMEDKNTVNRILSVSSDVSNQVLLDFWISCKATRAMPLYSIPGLVDHH